MKSQCVALQVKKCPVTEGVAVSQPVDVTDYVSKVSEVSCSHIKGLDGLLTQSRNSSSSIFNSAQQVN